MASVGTVILNKAATEVNAKIDHYPDIENDANRRAAEKLGTPMRYGVTSAAENKTNVNYKNSTLPAH